MTVNGGYKIETKLYDHKYCDQCMGKEREGKDGILRCRRLNQKRKKKKVSEKNRREVGDEEDQRVKQKNHLICEFIKIILFHAKKKKVIYTFVVCRVTT